MATDAPRTDRLWWKAVLPDCCHHWLVVTSMGRLKDSDLAKSNLLRVIGNLLGRDGAVMAKKMVCGPFTILHLPSDIEMHVIAALVPPVPHLMNNASATIVRKYSRSGHPRPLFHQGTVVAEANEEPAL